MLYTVYHKLDNGRLGASEIEADSPESAKASAVGREWEVVHVEPAVKPTSEKGNLGKAEPAARSEAKSVILALALSLGLCALVLTMVSIDWSKLETTNLFSAPKLGASGSNGNDGPTTGSQRSPLTANDVQGISVERRDLDYERSTNLFSNGKSSSPIDAAARLQIQRDWDRQPPLGVQYELSGSVTNPHSVAFSDVAVTIRFKNHSGEQVSVVTVETAYLGPRDTWRFKEFVTVDEWIHRRSAQIVRITAKQ